MQLKLGNILPIRNIPCGNCIHYLEHVLTEGAVFD